MASGDRLLAIRLYERNTRLSESLYGVIQGLEICLRNAIDGAFREHYGPCWYDLLPMLVYPLPQKLESAKQTILAQGKDLTPGRIVAELSFGFWTALIGRRYEKQIWVPHLHKVFPNAVRPAVSVAKGVAKLDRNDIARRLESTRQLRNRIAHHEPILHYDLNSSYVAVLEAMAWICPITAAWIELTNGFPARYAAPPGN